MSVPAVPVRPHPPTTSAGPSGHALGIRSLLMVPMLFVTFCLSFLVQAWILGWKDLEGSEPMSEQGAVGWLAFAVGMAIFLAPVAVGVYLGIKAERLGEHRLGLAGVLVNALLFLGLFVLIFISTLTQ